jgi:hypothetical protein
MNTTSPSASRREKKTGTTNRPVASEPREKGTAPDLSQYPDRWLKAPVKGYCPVTGLTRPALYDLARAGKIKTACIRRPGAVRGNRLFHVGSVLAFLDAEARATAAREVRA